MTIVFFTRLFYPHIGGVEKHVWEISKILQKKKHKVIIITEQYAKNLPLRQSYHGISIYRIPTGVDSWFKKFWIWKWLWENRSLISMANIAHCHDVFFWYLPFRFIFPNKKVFVTFHGYESYPISRKSIIQRKIAEILSFGNICIGAFIQKWYGTKANYVTYGGVTESQKSSSTNHAIAKKLKILLVGRLDEDIGIKTYLEALKILKKNNVNFTFEACGDGILRKEVEKYGRVYGFVKDVASYIQKASIIFSSSYLTILDALISMKPVFAVYDNDLKKDYLTMSPFKKFIYIENSASKIAEIISETISNSKRIIEGYKWAKSQSWESIVDIYLKLWQK